MLSRHDNHFYHAFPTVFVLKFCFVFGKSIELIILYLKWFFLIKFQFEAKMAELKEDCDKQMEAKDERLAMMKKQIAEALTGSSL